MIIASVIILEQCPLRLLHTLLILGSSKSAKFLRKKICLSQKRIAKFILLYDHQLF